jgi:hypothetical protein
MTKLITMWIVIVGAVTWIGWTLFAALNKIPGDTISEFMRGLAFRAAFVAFLLGATLGHWFGLPFADTAIVTYVRNNPGVAALLGFVVGAIVWSMK